MTNVLIFKIKKWQAFINQREKHSFYAHVKRNITYFKKKKPITIAPSQENTIKTQPAGREAVRATE